MALFDLGFKNNKMHEDLERIIYMQEHGIHSTYTGVSGLRNSDIFTAVRIIAADVASTKLKTKGHDTHPMFEDVMKMFNKGPDKYLSGWHFKFVIIANMLLNGSSYVEIIRGKNGIPKGLNFLHNDLVSLIEVDDGVYYNVSQNYENKNVRISRDDILHFRYITLDGYNGYSPLYALVNEIGISQGSKKFLRDFFENGGTSTSVLKYKKGQINAEQLQQLKDNFSNSQLKNNGGLVALDDTMEFNRLSVPTEVLNFLNSYKFSTAQVAKVFGLPVSKLGIETVNTSITQANLEYLQSTLYPIFEMFVAEIEKKIFNLISTDYELEFDTSRLIDIDPELRLKRTTELQHKGTITTNEARSVFGYKPIDNGDEPLVELNRTTLSNLSSPSKEVMNNDEQ